MIELHNVTKTFSGPNGTEIVALQSVELAVADGETHCLIGTSGCGKTTTLRLVNRLENPTDGTVSVGGRDVATLDAIVLRRRIGYVIQTGGLFPHMTVAQNVGILCELEGQNARQRRERVGELLELVGLPIAEFGDRYPADLSGGQAQRVGVARAFALDPDYVLMDEPFGALDPITRVQVRGEFAELARKLHKTILLVTHDLAEAFELGDRITLMHAGRVVQTGSARELMDAPANDFVRDFVTGQIPRNLGAAHGAGRTAR